MARVPVFVHVAIVPGRHAPVTHQDQGSGNGSVKIRPLPLARSSPRKPSVPDRVHFTGRRPKTTAEQVSGLRPSRPRHTVSGSRPRRTFPATPVPPSALCPGRSLEPRGTGPVVQERRRRPNQEQWLEARHLSGLAAPSSVDQILIQRPSSCRTQRPPESCGSWPGPPCGRPPSGPRCALSEPACAGNSDESSRHAESRSSPPQ